jgi:enoyl-CoA hydratase/carnithine racemase
MLVKQGIADCMEIRLASGVTNALTTDMLQALALALADAERETRGVLLCGGEKFFSNGADLEWALAQSSAGMREMFLAIGACVLYMLESRVPVVGVIKGHAIGAGLALLTACDYRYGARGRVLLGKPETLMGVPNPHFADQLLRFIAGDYFASDLIYSGRLITAEEAHTMHILHGVADKDEVEALAWQQLITLRDVPVAAFAESKHLRSGRLCAELREQMSARVARQVEIWNSDQAQTRLREAAKRLAR